MYYTGLEQKRGGPEAQRSSHKGYGGHPEGRPHKTPAARESVLAETPGRGLGLQGPAAPVRPCPHAWKLWSPRRLEAPGSGSSPTLPKSPAQPPPLLPSRWAFLPPRCRASSPHPRRPKANSTFSRALSPLPPPSSKCPPRVAWLCIKESWVPSAPHIPVNHEAWECS